MTSPLHPKAFQTLSEYEERLPFMEQARRDLEDAYASVAMLMFEAAFQSASCVESFSFYSDCEGGAITSCMIRRADGSLETSATIAYILSGLALFENENSSQEEWLLENDPTGIAGEFSAENFDELHAMEQKFSDALFFLRDFAWPHFSTALNSLASGRNGQGLSGGPAIEIARRLGLDSIAAAMEQAALQIPEASATEPAPARVRGRSVL